METVISTEVVEALIQLLTLIVAGVPIALLTAIIVQVAKWVKLLRTGSWLSPERLAVIHSLALGALWIGIQFYPPIEGPAVIVVLGIYGSLFSALIYEKVWKPIADKIGLPARVSDFEE